MPRATWLVALFLAFELPVVTGATEEGTVAALVGRLQWLASSHQYGGACVRIMGEPVVVVDPACLAEEATAVKADLILITHPHDDHCSREMVARLTRNGTVVVTVPECAALLTGVSAQVVTVGPGQRLRVAGVTIETVSAYNLVSEAHPRGCGWVGYVLSLGGVRIYFSGDTSFTPEMADLDGIDVAVLNLRRTYMMGGEEMAAAVETLRPSVVIPVHWLATGEAEELTILQERLPPGVELVLMSPE